MISTRASLLRRLALRRAALVVAVAAAGLHEAGTALAYGWPVKPFNQQHAIRGSFGDPRTIFKNRAHDGGLAGPGVFSFHNGIDISVSGQTRVYPVVSGHAFPINTAAVVVRAADGRAFQYFHIRPARRWSGQRVIARRTVLGYVVPRAEHVHFAEIVGGRNTNPLERGHLTPFSDRTRPRVNDIEVRDMRGRPVPSFAVRERISIVADASDEQPLPVPGPWGAMPLAPQALSWSLATADGAIVVRDTITVDFRTRLPRPRSFWRVYARGTYQNMPQVGRRRFYSMPGRFLFRVTPGLFDTRALLDGVYVVTVRARDSRGNVGYLSERIRVCNFTPACA